MKKIIWSPKAIENLEHLINFIDKKWGEKISDNLLVEIDNTIILISQNPLMFPLFSKKKCIRRGVIKKKSIIFYKAFSSEIHILLLVDARQNPKNYKF